MLRLRLKIVFTFIIGSSAIWFYKKYNKFQTFKRRGIKGPQPNLFLGNYLELRKSRDNKLPHQVIDDWIEQYGDIFGYYLPSSCRLVINDVNILKKIAAHKAFQDREKLVLDVVPLRDSLFATRGESWRRSRKVMSPLLSRFKVTSPPLTTIIDECVQDYMKHLKPDEVPEGSPFTVDIVSNIHRFTFDIIHRTSLGMESNCYSESNQLVKAVTDFFENAFNNAVLLGQIFPIFAWILTFINNYLTSGKMTDSIVAHLKNQITDFLNSKEPKDNEKVVFLKSMLTALAEGKINQQEFIANIYLIVLAGFEATANALIFCVYLIAKNEHIQEKMRDHLSEESEDESYIEMVWLESLRYYPPAIFVLSRQATETVNINGLVIEKDWVIDVPVWQIHHSEKYWPDPWTFDPERFNPENRKKIESASYLPFGFGSRTCLGINLANKEACRFLRSVISKYRLSFCEKTMDPFKFKIPSSILNPDGPVFLKFEPIICYN